MAMVAPVNTGKKQATRFTRGHSGNPNGRPRDSLNRTTLAAAALLDGEAEELTRKAIELARNNDITALRLCLERILPPRRERLIHFEMPLLRSASDAPQAIAAITAAVADGQITTTEADLAKLVEVFIKTHQATEIEDRLKFLEMKDFIKEDKPR
jgi:hypothetical protein